MANNTNKKPEKTANELFSDYYFSLPLKESTQFRLKVLEQTRWSAQVWRDRLNGRSKLDKLEQSAISNIAGTNIFEGVEL